MTEAEFRALIDRHRGRGVLLDTNLLLLYLVGADEPAAVATFERTNAFFPEHFPILAGIVRACGPIICSPNVLTETSNLCRARRQCRGLMRDSLPGWNEQFIGSHALSLHHAFERFGLSDISTLQVALAQHCLVLTGDLDLHRLLERNGVDSINIWRLTDLAAILAGN